MADPSGNTPGALGAMDVEVVHEETLYQGFFSLKAFRFRHRLFAGGWSQTLSRELLDRGHAAALLPYDPVRDQVVLVEQFRIGALVGDCQPWQLEIVAGMIEPGENPEAVVSREAVEEAGIQVDKLVPVTRYLSSSGGCSETLSVYAGCVDSRLAAGIHGLDDEGEDIKVHVVSREAAYDWVVSGKIENAASIIALQWLQLHYHQLQADWMKDGM